MIELKMFGNLAEALELYEQLGEQLEPDMAKAMNRMTHGIRTDVVKQVAGRGISRVELEDWKFMNARPGDMIAKAIMNGPRLGLETFAPNPSTFMGGVTQGGVSVNIMGEAHRFAHAFMGLKNSDPVRVLEREKGKNSKSKNKDKRYRLRHLETVSVTQIADDEEIVEVVVLNAQNRFVKQFDHLLGRLVEEFG